MNQLDVWGSVSGRIYNENPSDSALSGRKIRSWLLFSKSNQVKRFTITPKSAPWRHEKRKYDIAP